MIKREELVHPESCLNRAFDDEMVFVLRGRDPAAPLAIRTWVGARLALGKNTLADQQIQEAWACADYMESHPVTIPVPDTGYVYEVERKLKELDSDQKVRARALGYEE